MIFFKVAIRNAITQIVQRKRLAEWEKNGQPNPPPHLIKQRMLKSFLDKFDLHILIETGTYYGDMIEAMKRHVDRVYSIELSEYFYNAAKKRFARDKHIELIQGDSAIELGKLIERIQQPALFWLDGHYSAGLTARGVKDTPIFEELTYVLNTNVKHVILIDDARCFGTDPAYPSIEELTIFVKRITPDVDISVDLDCIRILHRQ